MYFVVIISSFHTVVVDHLQIIVRFPELILACRSKNNLTSESDSDKYEIDAMLLIYELYNSLAQQRYNSLIET